jgi:hypothetical protein
MFLQRNVLHSLGRNCVQDAKLWKIHSTSAAAAAEEFCSVQPVRTCAELLAIGCTPIQQRENHASALPTPITINYSTARNLSQFPRFGLFQTPHLPRSILHGDGLLQVRL